MNDNPLRQYFRRPATYIRLPSNYEYYDETIISVPENGDLPVYPMTAIDEITAKTPDALFNGSAVVDVIKSCIPSILNPWKIISTDIDAIMLAIRIASNGEEMSITCSCPKCNSVADYSVNLTNIMQSKKKVDYSSSLKLRDLEIKFRPLTYTEINKNKMSQFEIQKMMVELSSLEDEEEKIAKTKIAMGNLNKIMNDILTSTIEYIRTPETTVTNREFIKEFLDGCDKKTNNAIKEYSIDLRSKNELKPLKILCNECKHEYEQALVLNMSDFFD
jgi:hypothetical protein